MEHKKQIGEQLITWLSGEGKEQTMEDPNLSAWLAEDESHPKAFERYQQIWEGASSYIEPEAFSTQAAWNKVDRQFATGNAPSVSFGTWVTPSPAW